MRNTLQWFYHGFSHDINYKMYLKILLTQNISECTSPVVGYITVEQLRAGVQQNVTKSLTDLGSPQRIHPPNFRSIWSAVCLQMRGNRSINHRPGEAANCAGHDQNLITPGESRNECIHYLQDKSSEQFVRKCARTSKPTYARTNGQWHSYFLRQTEMSAIFWGSKTFSILAYGSFYCQCKPRGWADIRPWPAMMCLP